MTPRLACPFARYVDGMRVYCDKTKGFCGNVFFMACRGWWALNANAARCPIRKDGVCGEKQGTSGRCDPI